MKKYTVYICRVEHTLYPIEVEALNEEEAEDLAWEAYNDGDAEEDGDVVHAEEFCHEIESEDEDE